MPRASAAGLVAIVLSSFLAVQCNPFILKSCLIGGRRKEHVAVRAINDVSTGTSDSSSVHLKLYQQSSLKVQTDTPDHPATSSSESTTASSTTDKNETLRDPYMLKILEYVMVNETSSPFPAILAAVGSGGMAQLELFSIHVFGANYSEVDGVVMRERVIDMRNKTLFGSYIDLWKRERLIADSKDFPNDIGPKTDRSSKFTGPIQGHVRRMKRLRMERLTTDSILVDFLQRQPENIIERYKYQASRSSEETLKVLKDFAIWFRSQFPYYYQKCQYCGNNDGNECFGVVYPSPDELLHEAGRTELYACFNETCEKISRFPRYNAVCKVLDTRRGRCGEYSVLIMRMLDVMGYQAKWVADWADHVWCEVLVGNEWVHVDPCEASVNEPLIYQGWGKNQTYIVSYAYRDITEGIEDTDGGSDDDSLRGEAPVDVSRGLAGAPKLLELARDVTAKYTTKYNETLRRRLDDNVNETFVEACLQAARLELASLTGNKTEGSSLTHS